MDVKLQSEKISLVTFGFDQYDVVEEELWHLFRRTAVEPGQASFPDIASFADECLLCAQIFIREEEHPVANDSQATSCSSWAATLQDDAPNRDSGLGPQSSLSTHPLSLEDRKVGLIYLHAGPASIPAGEVNLGVIIKRGVRGRGYAREAVQLMTRWAFEEFKFHRVQAAVLDTPFKDKALRLFVGSGFAHEGTKRRSVYQPEGEGVAGIWKDVTYLAMLDTEWMLRSSLAQRYDVPEGPVVSFWDEMFARHSREREELLRWEDKHGRIKLSSSTETLRENGNVGKYARQDPAYLTDDSLSSVGEPSLSGSSPPSPRPNVFVTCEDDIYMEDSLRAPNADQWEHVVETSFASRRHRRSFLDLSPHGPTLALPSIPSTRLSELSEGNPQSPITIPSPTSVPPSSPSPSPVPSSPHSSWSDSENEDNWLLSQEGHPTSSNPSNGLFMTTPHETQPDAGSAGSGWRPRGSSVSSSSGSESWSDAHSSVWDMMSETSDQSDHGRL